MKTICVKCDRVFPAKRADARFCSGACRKAASRALEQGQDVLVTDNGQDDADVTDKPSLLPRPDDGLRSWIDKWGYIHRSPAGNRSQLPHRVVRSGDEA